tara:strand:- start:35 stop:577 length:543 start_codon:yes stop_codon:yes gene_type:complete
MIHQLFNHNFFVKFQAVNKDIFIEELESLPQTVDNCEWSSKCNVSVTNVEADTSFKLLSPNINELSRLLKRNFSYRVHDSWLNTYESGSYQEIHDHIPADISCVFFLNHGKDFSEFYFRERNNADVSHNLRILLGFYDLWTPKVRAGDIIFFPSNLLHGVSQHKSKTQRKTFSSNIHLTQ